MPDKKTRTYRIEGLSTIALPDGTIIHKLMVRIKGRYGRSERWIDCPENDFGYQIGDSVTVRKLPPYVIVTPQKVGDEDEQCSPNS